MSTNNSNTDDVAEYKDPDILRRLYHGNNMSLAEIGDDYGVNAATIRYHMEKHGIERDKAYHDPTRPPNHLLDTHGEGVGNNYEKIRTHHDGEKHVVLVHRLIAYAHGKIDFNELCNSDVVVHHKSGHGWDNRPENLDVLAGQSEHMVHHTDERYGDGGWRDKERLKELLEETTQKEAAKILGCSKRTVYEWKKRHGLE